MSISDFDDGELTNNKEYAERLIGLQTAGWKEKLRFLDPYGWHIKAACPGKVLEVGSGIGRNLLFLKNRSVGVDHNTISVDYSKQRGCEAYGTEEFLTHVDLLGTFDTLLLSHVLEHVSLEVEDEIIQAYLPYLKPIAKIVLICPQEVGYKSDSTHIRWVDEISLRGTLERLSCKKIRIVSFPFPRFMGRHFIYNQFVASGIL